MKSNISVVLSKRALMRALSLMALSLMVGLSSACIGPAPEPTVIIPELLSVSITSTNDNPDYARLGDSVTLSFKSREVIQEDQISVTFNGNAADSITNDGGIVWQATRIMQADDAEGEVVFAINFLDSSGNACEQGPTIGDRVIFDVTPPEITGTVTEDATLAPDGAEWHFSNVMVRFEARDTLSGVADISSDTGTATSGRSAIIATLAIEGEGQSVTGTATDMAGNSASDTVAGINIKKPIIVLVMGGAISEGIFSTASAATSMEGLDFSGGGYAQLEGGGTEIEVAMAIIGAMSGMYTNSLGADISDIRLLLIGKSLGAAKLYRMLYEYAPELAAYRKVALVLVDAHSVPPQDEGELGWNGPEDDPYIYFTGSDTKDSTYNLGWLSRPRDDFNELFNSADGQEDLDCKLRIFNIYSRNVYRATEWVSILGYSYTDAYINLEAGNWNGYSYGGDEYRDDNVFNLETGDWEEVAHFNIDLCRETRNLIREAIVYLRY